MPSAIVTLWVRLIDSGQKELKDVPKLLRERVEAELAHIAN